MRRLQPLRCILTQLENLLFPLAAMIRIIRRLSLVVGNIQHVF